MSIANFINSNTDNNSIINCKELNCKNIDCINLDAQNIIVPGNVDTNTLYVKELNASLPNTEIQFNNDLEIEENNINNSGQIESKGIILNEDSTFVKNTLAQVHIQKNNGSPILFLESAGTGGECFIDFKQQNGQVAGQIQLDWPPIACMDFKVGQVASPDWGLFRFFASQVSSTPTGDLPNFITNTEIMRIGGSGTLEINMYKECKLNNNDISEINDCEIQNNLDVQGLLTNTTGDIIVNKSINFQSMFDAYNINNLECEGLMSYPNAILNNSATQILVKDGVNIKYREDSTFGNMRFVDKVYLPVSNYSTASVSFVPVGNDLSITDLEAGDYILQYSGTLRNTVAGSGTECEMLQDGATQLDIFGMEGFTTTSLFSSFSGTAHINIAVTATTSFRMGIRALANTAVLNKYSVTLFRIL